MFINVTKPMIASFAIQDVGEDILEFRLYFKEYNLNIWRSWRMPD